jgi:hypothetical protein
MNYVGPFAAAQPTRASRLSGCGDWRFACPCHEGIEGKHLAEAARYGRVEPVRGQCLCGAVSLEIDFPARWAWHDHSRASRLTHGAAYATYVGSWRKRLRIIDGEDHIARYEDESAGTRRSFCSRCGTPLMYERKLSPHMVNIPRALFSNRTGRQPLYHSAFSELPDWAYTGASLVPLKGFPGIVWERPRRRKAPR